MATNDLCSARKIAPPRVYTETINRYATFQVYTTSPSAYPAVTNITVAVGPLGNSIKRSSMTEKVSRFYRGLLCRKQCTGIERHRSPSTMGACALRGTSLRCSSVTESVFSNALVTVCRDFAALLKARTRAAGSAAGHHT